MLDLEAGVHLEEVEASFVGVEQELDRAGVDISASLGGRQRGLAEGLAVGGRQTGRRGLLDQLLVAPLHRAVPFAEEDTVAMGVEQDLASMWRGLGRYFST